MEFTVTMCIPIFRVLEIARMTIHKLGKLQMSKNQDYHYMYLSYSFIYI